MKKEKLLEAEKVLVKHGISADKAPEVLRETAQAMLGRDVYDVRLEDRQHICNALCEAIRLTGNGGNEEGNVLEALMYLPDKEVVRPVFANGAGRNGYYDVNVAWDSGTALITDVVNQFVKKMW